MPPKLSFFAPAKERIKYLKQKRPKLSFDYDEIMHYAHHEAFTVAKVTKLSLLQTIQKSLIKAQEEGQNFEVWKEQLKPKLQKAGWLGKTAVTNPSTGEVKEIFVGSKRLKTIYYTNLRTTQARSNYKEAINAGASGFRYIAILDGKTRAEHKLLHNITLPINDKFWDTHYPPNGWNCRCKVMPIFSDSFTPPNKVPDIAPHPDWAYHVGKKSGALKAYKQKLRQIVKDDKNVLKEYAQKELNTHDIIKQENAKRFREIQKLFNPELKSNFWVDFGKTSLFKEHKKTLLSQQTILTHAHHKDITAFEYSLIPRILENKEYLFEDGINHLIVVSPYMGGFRLVLKNVENKDEVFISSLIKLKGDYKRQLQKLKRNKKEIKWRR